MTSTNIVRRDFLASSLIGAIGFSLAGLSGGGALAAVPTDTPAGGADIRPFAFHASSEALADLRARILATNWPDRETVNDASQGVNLATMRKLADYWATRHDWRKAEARLNAYPNFITTIDGVDIHFIHVRSKHPNALPVIITHGWPGSIIEQMKVIGPLTDPTAHGGTAADAFDVVIPRCPATAFRASRPRPAGTRSASPTRGSS